MEELVTIMPQDVCRYLNFKAYGKEYPDESDLPTKGRSNFLKAIKKKLSYFMPRKNTVWDDIRAEGNPTRSILVDNLIKRVMKFEVRQLGEESKARRPMELQEFINILTMTRKNDTQKIINKYRLGSLLCLQWHIIGNIKVYLFHFII